MCGIAGFLFQDKIFSETDIEKMTACLVHRGPDAKGVFMDGKVALGHRRLSIIDLNSRSDQPMHSHSGRYVISYNGEVYNHKEIAVSLNIPLKTTSDTEVIVEAFEK